MSVKTSVSSTAQSLSTRPGMLSGPGALRALILLRDLLTLSEDSVITWSPGGGGVFCAVVLFCASKRAKKAFSSFSRGIYNSIKKSEMNIHFSYMLTFSSACVFLE